MKTDKKMAIAFSLIRTSFNFDGTYDHRISHYNFAEHWAEIETDTSSHSKVRSQQVFPPSFVLY